MTRRPKKRENPENIISIKNGTAFVIIIIFPCAPGLTELQKKRIDAAQRVRFFVYGCSDMPPGASGVGSFEQYPVDSLRWAISRSTYIAPETIDCRHLREAPKSLIALLMAVAADACSDEHRSAVLILVDRSFNGDDFALCRPPPSATAKEARR
jgi:hypothetical protein